MAHDSPRVRDAALLRQLLRSQGLTVRDAASEAGCSKSYVSALANGTRTACSPYLADRLARTLGVRVDVLFDPPASDLRGQKR